MTDRQIAARRYSRHCRQRRRIRRQNQVAAAVLLALLALPVYLFLKPGPVIAKAPAAVTTAPEAAQAEAVQEPTPEPTPEPVRHRDDIVSDGQLLAYDLQETMQDLCECYGVPYALALAIAEVETHFDPDAVSSGGDTGLMQINPCNHAWLLERGMDVHTYAGNIEAGIYLIAGHLDTYGDMEKALMAYNCGPSGAKKLWDAGVYQTDYSRKVMAAFERWTSILED